MNRLISWFCPLFLWILFYTHVEGQRIALRTNAFADVLTAFNLGVEICPNDYSSLIGTGFVVPNSRLELPSLIRLSDKYRNVKSVKGVGIQFEYRYWFAHQTHYNFFSGVQVSYGYLNMSYKTKRQHLNIIPIGFEFGYSWPLNPDKWKINKHVSTGLWKKIVPSNFEISGSSGPIWYADRLISKKKSASTNYNTLYTINNFSCSFVWLIPVKK